MSLLKEIGAILGLVAFGGMAVLAFLTFQQARHVRRLREWAGRSPERAAVEADRVADVASEATIARSGGKAPEREPEEDEEDAGPTRAERLRGEMAYRWEELDRRSPADPKILVAGLVAVLIGVGIVTGGFGLFGGSDQPASSSQASSGSSAKQPKPVKVAVLNGTAPTVGGVGVTGVADAASGYVKDAGFDVGKVDNAPPTAESTIMYSGDAKADAEKLATALQPQLGDISVVAYTPEIQAAAGKADIALIIGADDSSIS